jgi:hypothetical protein
MQPRREGMIWQVLGLLVIAAALDHRRSRPKSVVHWVFQLLLECQMINTAATATNARM